MSTMTSTAAIAPMTRRENGLSFFTKVMMEVDKRQNEEDAASSTSLTMPGAEVDRARTDGRKCAGKAVDVRRGGDHADGEQHHDEPEERATDARPCGCAGSKFRTRRLLPLALPAT